MQKTGYSDLLKYWTELGVQAGDLILIHSSLPALGVLDGGPKAVLDSLRQVLTPTGTIVVPSFTYSAFKQEVYDPATTRSTVGVLGDVLNGYEGAKRSLDPNFSNVGLGPKAKELLQWDETPSLGTDSFYDRFVQQQGHVLLLGVDYTALPLFMHLERMLNVPYRYEKAFDSRIIIDGEIVEKTCWHSVRDEKTNAVADRNRVGVFLDQEMDCRKIELPYGDARYLPAQTIQTVVTQQYQIDPLILLDKETPFETDHKHD